MIKHPRPFYGHSECSGFYFSEMMAPTNLSVLIVDDSPLVHTMIKSVLFSRGIRKVSTADTMETALEKIPRFLKCPFDVIFLDRYLQSDCGLEILKYVRERDKSVPIIMLTVEDEAAKIIEAINLGASDYIVKPFTEDTVVKKLELHLKHKLSVDEPLR